MKFEHISGHCALYVAAKQRIYVLAGRDQNNCEFYDLIADSCSEIASVNDKWKDWASACLFNDKFIYLVGGNKD